MDITTDSQVEFYGSLNSDTGNSHIEIDVTQLADVIRYQNQLIFLTDILLFAILVFMAFKVSLRGLWK